MRNFYIKLLT